MSITVLNLNLAPPSNFWRSNHVLLGWTALGLGGLILVGSLGFTWSAYQQAAASGRLAVSLSGKSRATAEAQARILTELRSVDVAKELPRWRLAERIYTERSLPWSRLTSEVERSLVQDVRIKSIQRSRGTDLKVQIKLRGEARSRGAEAAFVEALQKNPCFDQVVLEREGERQGGGVEFDYTLVAVSSPPPYQPLPKFAPPSKRPVQAAAPPGPVRAPVPAPKAPSQPAPEPQLPSPERPRVPRVTFHPIPRTPDQFMPDPGPPQPGNPEVNP